MGGWGGLIAEPTEEHTELGPEAADWKVDAGEGAVVWVLGGGEKGEAKGELAVIAGEVAFGGNDALLLLFEMSSSRNGDADGLGV